MKHIGIKRFAFAAMAFVLVGQGCLGFGGGSTAQPPEEVELDIWRVFDNDDTFDGIISAYQSAHPNVTINYRELRFEEYEDALLRAFAEGEGPDIFSIHNTWIGEYGDLIYPMPQSVTISEQVVEGQLRRQLRTIQTQKATMSVKTLKETFVEQVARDVVRDHQYSDGTVRESIVGLPLAMDSLALFYNKDLLDAAGIPTPPRTWSEFQQQVIALTELDQQGEITQSGAALGTAENVERSADILALLMMQNGAEMTDERGRITFNTIPARLKDERDVPPALVATEFYTDFANPSKEVYTWNDSYDSSFEAFANGQTAFFLGYSYHLPFLRAAAPKLNFSVTYVPQIDTSAYKVNLANYWVETVSRTSPDYNWAWDFLLYASSAEGVSSYLSEAQKPTALRSLISSQLDDEDLGIFAEQTLTARHWYLGNDAAIMEEAFTELINGVLANPQKPIDLLNFAARRVAQTF